MNVKTLKDNLIKNVICINNIYLDKYVKLICDNIKSQKQRGWDKHHIIPRYYYKFNNCPIDNSKENLVYLSRADHILAHIYLMKCSTIDHYVFSNAYAISCFVKQKQANNIFYNLEEFIQLHRDEINLAAITLSKLQSERYKNKPHYLTPEGRKKVSESSKKRKNNLNKVGITYNNQYMFIPKDQVNIYLGLGAVLGRGPHSQESKNKNRQSHLGKPLPHTKEWNEKISNANKNKKLSKDTKQKISLALKGNLDKCGQNNRGKIAINNGKIRKYVFEQEFEQIFKHQGWIRGELKRNKNSVKGKIRINNGITAKYVTLEEFENNYSKEGWHRGYEWKKDNK